mmetsp:Transcript_24246/g.70868  ORF Transcript_24246/g.70868 Transcript_24246/m.70868 type:complete len:566 (-) Transcript_24246:97-1794(-)
MGANTCARGEPALAHAPRTGPRGVAPRHGGGPLLHNNRPGGLAHAGSEPARAVAPAGGASVSPRLGLGLPRAGDASTGVSGRSGVSVLARVEQVELRRAVSARQARRLVRFRRGQHLGRLVRAVRRGGARLVRAASAGSLAAGGAYPRRRGDRLLRRGRAEPRRRLRDPGRRARAGGEHRPAGAVRDAAARRGCGGDGAHALPRAVGGALGAPGVVVQQPRRRVLGHVSPQAVGPRLGRPATKESGQLLGVDVLGDGGEELLVGRLAGAEHAEARRVARGQQLLGQVPQALRHPRHVDDKGGAHHFGEGVLRAGVRLGEPAGDAEAAHGARDLHAREVEDHHLAQREGVPRPLPLGGVHVVRRDGAVRVPQQVRLEGGLADEAADVDVAQPVAEDGAAPTVEPVRAPRHVLVVQVLERLGLRLPRKGLCPHLAAKVDARDHARRGLLDVSPIGAQVRHQPVPHQEGLPPVGRQRLQLQRRQHRRAECVELGALGLRELLLERELDAASAARLRPRHRARTPVAAAAVQLAILVLCADVDDVTARAGGLLRYRLHLDGGLGAGAAS